MTETVIDTSSVPYRYSVVITPNPEIVRSLRAGGLVTLEISVEVSAGKLGIVWTDAGIQPIGNDGALRLGNAGCPARPCFSPFRETTPLGDSKCRWRFDGNIVQIGAHQGQGQSLVAREQRLSG